MEWNYKGYVIKELDMVVECCVCHRLIRIDRDVLNRRESYDKRIAISHGYCKPCYEEALRQLDES